MTSYYRTVQIVVVIYGLVYRQTAAAATFLVVRKLITPLCLNKIKIRQKTDDMTRLTAAAAAVGLAGWLAGSSSELVCNKHYFQSHTKVIIIILGT